MILIEHSLRDQIELWLVLSSSDYDISILGIIMPSGEVPRPWNGCPKGTNIVQSIG